MLDFSRHDFNTLFLAAVTFVGCHCGLVIVIVTKASDAFQHVQERDAQM